MDPSQPLSPVDANLQVILIIHLMIVILTVICRFKNPAELSLGWEINNRQHYIHYEFL